MQIKKVVIRVLAGIVLLAPASAAAQSSSINTFSPYTLYGLGDLTTPGPAYIRSMGGAGVAYRDMYRINYLNPAASTAGRRQALLLNMGLEGANYYLKSERTSSSYNTFNIRDVAIQFPLGRIVSMGVSVTPFSAVGYRINKAEDNPDILTDLKQVDYTYSGSGGLTQMKAGLGLSVTPKLSVGAEMVYYLGNIQRSFNVIFTSFNGQADDNIYAWEKNEVSRVFANFGVQYSPILTDKRLLTIGATYQPGGKLSPKSTRMIPTGYTGHTYSYALSDWISRQDTISASSELSRFDMPDLLTVGVFYRGLKGGIGADYSFQGWGRNDDNTLTPGSVRYRNTNSFKLGGEYTPNRIDVRNFMNRLTYRAGVRYSEYYMQFNGQNIDEKAVTLGVGLPLRAAGVSNINFGVEVGTRGNTRNNMIRENYFKFSIGISLFGDDYWFVKYKYD